MPTRYFPTWGWEISGVKTGGNSDLNSGLTGNTYTIGTNATYRDDLTWSDEYENNPSSTLIYDSDTDDNPNLPGTENGVLVNGEFTYVNEVVEYFAEVTLEKGGETEVYNFTLRMFQTDTGITFVRPVDSDTQTLIDAGYNYRDVKSIKIGNPELDGGSAERTGFSAGSHDLLFCFVSGTMIETKNGTKLIEDLSVGDLILTRDNGYQPIRWIGSRTLDAPKFAANPHLRPIRIRAGALGPNIPESDLLVSPQHRILVRSKIAQRMFGSSEVLAGAKHLLMIDGIGVANDLDEVTYHHILFDRHEIVISNNAETESFYTGPQALKSVGKTAFEEILTIFPELRDRDHSPVSARLLPTARQARQLAQRHTQNGKILVEFA